MTFDSDNLEVEFQEGRISADGTRINRYRVLYLGDEETVGEKTIQKPAIDRLMTAADAQAHAARLTESAAIFTGIYNALAALDSAGPENS